MKIMLISTSTYPADQGLRSVSSNLKKVGNEVKIVFLPMDEDYGLKYGRKVMEQLVKICKNFDLIGVASYASTSIRAKQVIRYLKRLGKPIVWGGIHATLNPEDCIKEVDYVCRGEGEEAIIEFVEKLEKGKDLSKIRNFWVKYNGKVHKNEIKDYIQELDSLKEPDYDLEDHFILEKGEIIKFEERHLNGQIFFQTERGCPNACTYCLNKRIRDMYKGKGKVIRANSPEYVVKEMARLRRKFKSLGYFDVRDETFFVRPLKDIKKFAEMYDKYVGIRFKCLADPPTMDEEKLRLLVEAGLTDIIVGIQGGSDRVNFEVYKRYIKQEQVVRAAKILNKFKDKVAVMYDMITTNPYEEKEDVLESINLVRRLPKPFFLSVNNLVFFPGSELHQRAVREGIVKNKKDSAFNLNYWDRFEHIKLKKKNAYLNLILNLMRGVCTEKRYGLMPEFVLRFLLKKERVEFNLRNPGFTFAFGFLVQGFDVLREKVMKPLYRSLPVEFKVWYDKVRYRV